jgi:hypothetical protein
MWGLPMQPPTVLVKELESFDRGLHVRWSNAVGRFCIERHHGYAGLGTDEVLKMLRDKWKRLEDESASNPDLELEARLAYDEFESRKLGYQPILYVQLPCDPEVIICTLLEMDIRRAGGPEGWVKTHKDALEKAKTVRAMQRRNRLRNLAEEAYDRVRLKKDFYGSGGDPYFYQLSQ